MLGQQRPVKARACAARQGLRGCIEQDEIRCINIFICIFERCRIPNAQGFPDFDVRGAFYGAEPLCGFRSMELHNFWFDDFNGLGGKDGFGVHQQ